VKNKGYEVHDYAIFSMIRLPPFSGPNILNTLFSKTLSLYTSLKARDQVLHPYSTTDKSTILYILICSSLY